MKQLLRLCTIILVFNLASCSGGSSGSNDSGNVDLDLIPVSNSNYGNYGYIDTKGKMVINPQYTYATMFRDGLALVRTKGDSAKWGFIDKNGKYAIQPTYKYATIFNEGLALVANGDEAPKAVNEKGEVKFTLTNALDAKPFQEGLAAFSTKVGKDARWGFIDKDGKVVINPQFQEVRNFSNGLCAVQITDFHWGFIDKEGKIVINPQFLNVGEFKDGKDVVATGDKYGVIDKKGTYIINPQYEGMAADGEEYIVINENKAGWIDETGKPVINLQFDGALPFKGNDIAPAVSGKSVGYIDRKGTFKINPQFDAAFPFYNDVAIVANGGRCGMIDKDGKYIVNPQYDRVAQDYASCFLPNLTSMYLDLQSDLYKKLKSYH